MQGAAHGTGGSGGRIVITGTGGSISTARWRPSNIVSRSSSVSSAPGEAAIIPEAKVSGYGGITRISTSTVEVLVNNVLVRIGGWNQPRHPLSSNVESRLGINRVLLPVWSFYLLLGRW